MDEVAEKFIITPRLKDQIVFRTDENQWEVLAENLKDENKKSTIERIKKDYEKVYDKSYAMLTTLMEQHGRNDWLFIKTCYKNIPGSSQIVREMEVIINQHIKGMLFQYYDIRSRYFENQQSLICLHHQWEGSMDGFVFSTNAL